MRNTTPAKDNHPAPALGIYPIRGMPEIKPGDDLGEIILGALAGQGTAMQSGDVLVVAQKIVSKAEGSRVALGAVKPSPLAISWAGKWGRDPRLVEVVLRESRKMVRMDKGVMIAETHHGFVCANAGVDLSNSGDKEVAILLPEDSDRSAKKLWEALRPRGGKLGVIIADSFGRPWRVGLTQVALGVAGMSPLVDYRGKTDESGVTLRATEIAVADELACAAELVCGKLDKVPAAIIRGWQGVFWEDAPDDATGGPSDGAAGGASGGAALRRDPLHDLFR